MYIKLFQKVPDWNSKDILEISYSKYLKESCTGLWLLTGRWLWWAEASTEKGEDFLRKQLWAKANEEVGAGYEQRADYEHGADYEQSLNTFF